MIDLSIKSRRREELIDVTSELSDLVAKSGTAEGFVHLWVPHTTAAVTINENADPDVPHDLISKLQRLIPQSDGYRHAEGNSDAHLKSSLLGCSLSVPIEAGRLVLGTWQGIFFCEFDGPRSRHLLVRVSPSA